MDTARFEELKKKRFEEGLTTEEAEELGRMFAEQEGAEYQSAQEYRAELESEGEKEGGEKPEAGLEAEPETLNREAESEEMAAQDRPAGTREPIGAEHEDTKGMR
jgi:hypothetical protein